MKTYFFTIIFTLTVAVTLAQKPKAKATQTKSPEPAAVSPTPTTPSSSLPGLLTEHFARKYSIAQRWGDYDVAKDALYDLVTEFPGNDSLIFSIAYFYFENQKYTSCALVCNDLLTRNSRNPAALELSAVSYENLNIKDRAFQSYESLYLINSDISTLYKMASLQFELKRYEESLVNADIMLSKPQSDSLKVAFNDSKNVSKEHPLKAALFNLKGLSYKAQGNTVQAKKSFEEALKVDPSFENAKQNLASVK